MNNFFKFVTDDLIVFIPIVGYLLYKTCLHRFLIWYMGENFSKKDVFDLALSVFAIIFLCLGFFRNKTYYEDVSLEYYPIGTEQYSFTKNLADEESLDAVPNKIVIVSPANVPIQVNAMTFTGEMDTEGNPIYKQHYKNNKKFEFKIEPGQALKLSYNESEGIPNYQLRITTEYGEGYVLLQYNGRFGNINETKIKSTRKVIPYFMDKMLN
ncbi:hypothetical protein P7G96_00720 [Enterococcus thailandicus]|uniref:hypothetical protein n=1 Tax=Enterococcus thailandicus TaxID=417368 RepID=UPI00289044D7|nr:hypothetical protein [Enterococcus thailandicus]MDT2750436.1 hypothetical protein [Enterococcus thailandicus]MDT2774997.1 hypothetical protein [Enterococcus thailandicus]